MSEPSADEPAIATAQRQSAARRPITTNVLLVALAGWLIPGLGFFLIGQRWRGYWACGAIVFLFVAGLFIGGARVIDVPGYEEGGRIQVAADTKARVRFGDSVTVPTRWQLTASPFAALMEAPWYAAQIMAGPICLGASALSIDTAASYPKPTVRLGEIGALYCSIAGMMNLVVLIDAAARASAMSNEGGAGK